MDADDIIFLPGLYVAEYAVLSAKIDVKDKSMSYVKIQLKNRSIYWDLGSFRPDIRPFIKEAAECIVIFELLKPPYSTYEIAVPAVVYIKKINKLFINVR